MEVDLTGVDLMGVGFVGVDLVGVNRLGFLGNTHNCTQGTNPMQLFA